MANNYEIPAQPGRPFSERCSIGGLPYSLQFYWNDVSQNWVVDFYEQDGLTPVLLGVALVTGADLLEEFGYLDLGAFVILTAMTTGPDVSPDTVPTFANFGIEGHLYVTTP